MCTWRGEVLEEPQGGAVGEVQVLEDEDDRMGLSGVGQERGHALEEPVPVLVFAAVRRLGQIGQTAADLGDEVGHVRGSAAEL